MPLIHGKSKKAFSKNVEIEMKHGKPQDQALAIAYNIKKKSRKKKAAGGSVQSGSPDMNMAEGGMAYKNDSAKSESRPMPRERDNDSHQVSRNSGDKAPAKGDSAKSGEDISYQAKKGMKTTKIKHPKMVPQSLYSARLRDEEDDLQSSASVNEGPQRQPPQHDNEEDASSSGHELRDMEDEHSTHRKPYAQGGQVEESDYRHEDPMHDSEELDMESESGIQEHERSQEHHMQSELDPSEDEGHSDAMSRNEEGPDRQGPKVPDMEAPHNRHQRSAYAQGGEIDLHHDMDDQPMEEEDMMREASLAAAIMSKRKMDSRRIHSGSPDEDDAAGMYAEGGEIHSHDSIYSDDSDQVDLSRNADEDANEEDQLSFNALRKENYSESEGLNSLNQPSDSNLIDDPRESSEENEHDGSLVDKIRKKMRMKSPISR